MSDRGIIHFLSWSPASRIVVFLLGASAIGCFVADFYDWCTMQTAIFGLLLPAMAALITIMFLDRARGDCRLFDAVLIGAVAGLIAAGAGDLVRLPFAFAKEWGIDHIVPAIPLFSIYPRIGALVLGQPPDQETYSAAAYVFGWLFHFVFGAALGVMYTALIGDGSRRSCLWAIAFAFTIRTLLLTTVFSDVLGFAPSYAFVGVALAVYLVFAAVMGVLIQAMYRVANSDFAFERFAADPTD